MTSPTDICNRALSEIGARTIISDLSEPSPAARNCRLHYDRLRRMLLRGAHWNFARSSTSALTQIGSVDNGTNTQPWQYTYSYPSDCLLFRFLFPQGNLLWFPQPQFQFVISGKTILCNLPQAGGVYTRDETDCDVFDSMFEDALVQSIAAHVLIALTGNGGEKQSFLQAALQSVQMARAADGMESTETTDFTPDWIRARTDYLTPYSYFSYFYMWQPLAWEGAYLAG